MVKPDPLESLTVEQRAALDKIVKAFRASLRRRGVPKDEIKRKVGRYVLALFED